MTTEFLLEVLSLGREGEFRKSLSAFAIFHVPTAQNNQYAKVAYLGEAYSATFHNIQNCKIMNLCCVSHQVCGNLLQLQ